MKFTSPVYSAVSGSIAGITYSHNRGGMYTRARAVPTNPSSALQQVVRNAFSALATAWTQTLTALQRAAWETYAANVPVIDPLGATRFLTGQQRYIGANTVRRQALLTDVDDAPVIFDDGGSQFWDSLAASEATQGLLLNTGTNVDIGPWADEDDAAMLVYTGLPQPRSVNFYAGPYRYAFSVLGDSVTPPSTLVGTVANGYQWTGSVPAALAIPVKARVTRADGRLSAALSGLAVTTA
jgi:hypothetical protein